MIGRLDGSIRKDWTTISRDKLRIAGTRRASYPYPTREGDEDKEEGAAGLRRHTPRIGAHRRVRRPGHRVFTSVALLLREGGKW